MHSQVNGLIPSVFCNKSQHLCHRKYGQRKFPREIVQTTIKVMIYTAEQKYKKNECNLGMPYFLPINEYTVFEIFYKWSSPKWAFVKKKNVK